MVAPHSLQPMRPKGRAAARVVAAVFMALTALIMSGCSGGEDVFESSIEPVEWRITAPSYVLYDYQGESTIVAGDARHTIRKLSGADWLPDGNLLIHYREARRTWIRVVDPETMEPQGPRRPWRGEIRVTPEAITMGDFYKAAGAIRVYSMDLSSVEVVRVRQKDVESDNFDQGAEFDLTDYARTLGGATWVEWYANSENDWLTDHGLLRVEDGEVTEVQRNTAIARVYASDDGTALLLLRQNRGDEDCGGCIVEQNVAEIDPATGEIVGEYGMPDGYTRDWRVLDADKIDGRVVVAFYIDASEIRTYAYDGTWSEVPGTTDTLTRWQGSGGDPSGRLVIRQSTRNKEGSIFNWPYSLTWEDADGSHELLSERESCLRNDDHWSRCKEPIVPGSLLPE